MGNIRATLACERPKDFDNLTFNHLWSTIEQDLDKTRLNSKHNSDRFMSVFIHVQATEEINLLWSAFQLDMRHCSLVVHTCWCHRWDRSGVLRSQFFLNRKYLTIVFKMVYSQSALAITNVQDHYQVIRWHRTNFNCML